MDNAPAVLVLGGGPAGTSLAIRLAEAGLTTVVFERSWYDAPRVGEVLVPTIRPHLTSLSVWNRFLADEPLASPGVVSIWQSTEPRQRDNVSSPFGNAWHIDRLKFDRMLADAAEAAGAVVIAGARPHNVGRTRDGWWVEVRRGERIERFHARFLVDATGRTAWLARRLGSRRLRSDRMLAIVARIENADVADPDRRLLLEATSCGWWYCARLPRDVLIASCLIGPASSPQFVRDPLAFWRAELTGTEWIGKRLAGTPPPTTVKVVSAESSRLTAIGGADWLALGDAATTWDPLTSQGMFKAVAESDSAAHAIRSALAGDGAPLIEHVERITDGFRAHCRSRREYYACVDRWPESPFWLPRGRPARHLD